MENSARILQSKNWRIEPLRKCGLMYQSATAPESHTYGIALVIEIRFLCNCIRMYVNAVSTKLANLVQYTHPTSAGHHIERAVTRSVNLIKFALCVTGSGQLVRR